MKSTQHIWKFYIVVLAVGLGALIMFWGMGAFIVSRSGIYQIIVGGSLGALGIVFGAFTIRCPACAARWFWIELMTLKKEWAKRLLMQSECPVCNFTIDDHVTQQAYAAAPNARYTFI
jgi:hypothetical protein